MDQSIVHSRALDWRAGALPVLLLAVLTALLYWPSVAALGEIWGSVRGVYSQGYLIGAASVWVLAVRARECGAHLLPQRWGLPVVLALGFMWLIGARAGIQTATALMLPAVVFGAIFALFGAAVARACLFPCAFLLLAIPLWDALSAPLQAIAAQAATAILSLAQVPAVHAGNFIHIRAGTFEIAPECSGLGMLLVGLATAALYGEMQRQPLSRRLALLALAAALSLFANWIRVAGIIYVAHRQGMHASLVHDHYGFGWMVFALMLVGFFPLARRIVRADAVAPLPARPFVAAAPTGRAGLTLALILIGLAVGPAWYWLASGRAQPHISAQLPEDPGAGWVGPELLAPGAWVPQFPGADATRTGVYRRGAEAVTAFTAAYAEQRHAKKLAGYGVAILAPDEVAIARAREQIRGAQLAEIEAAAPEGPHVLLWLRYSVGERHFTSAWWAQLYYGWASLTAAPASGIMLFRAPCGGDCADARATLARFASDTRVLAPR